MNKQEVIDYVMNTPHNVNRTILSQRLDEIGTQADWNQNDPTKPDYVKNRPFYSEMAEKTIRTTPDFGGDILNGFPAFVVGDTVTVKVDGVEYSFVAFGNEYVAFIGDSLEDIANSTGQYGWYITCDIDYLESWFFGQKNFTVSYTCEIDHKIEGKYLPGVVMVSSEDEEEVQSVKIKLRDENADYMFQVEDGELSLRENDERRRARIVRIHGNTIPTHTSGTKTLIDTTVIMDTALRLCCHYYYGLIVVECGGHFSCLQSHYLGDDNKKFTGYGTLYNPSNEMLYRYILTIEAESALTEGVTCHVKCDVTAVEQLSI